MESLYQVVDIELLPEEYLPDDYTGTCVGSLAQITGQQTVFRFLFTDTIFLNAINLPVPTSHASWTMNFTPVIEMPL